MLGWEVLGVIFPGMLKSGVSGHSQVTTTEELDALGAQQFVNSVINFYIDSFLGPKSNMRHPHKSSKG